MEADVACILGLQVSRTVAGMEEKQEAKQAEQNRYAMGNKVYIIMLNRMTGLCQGRIDDQRHVSCLAVRPSWRSRPWRAAMKVNERCVSDPALAARP